MVVGIVLHPRPHKSGAYFFERAHHTVINVTVARKKTVIIHEDAEDL